MFGLFLITNLEDGFSPDMSHIKLPCFQAFLAPFSILLAMFSALSDCVPKLSMTEDEIKTRAQSLTDTDLQDKQNGSISSLSLWQCSDHVPKLSMTEGEIKTRAQSRTDTDLQDKQNGSLSSLPLSVSLKSPVTDRY